MVRLGYLVLGAIVFGAALGLGAWIVQVWGAFGFLPCNGHTACSGAPPVLSWPFVALLLVGIILVRLGRSPSRPPTGSRP